MKISYTKYLIILLVVFIISMGSTLAYYSWGSTENTNIAFDVIADTVYIYYEDGESIIGVNLYPTDDKEDGIKKEITVKVDEYNEYASYNLYLDLKTLPEELKDESFRYALYNGNTVLKSGSVLDTTSTCATNSTNHIVLLSNVTPTTTEVKYTLYIWIDGVNYTNPSDMMNQSFEFILHADGVNLVDAAKRPGTLYYELMSNSVVDNKSSQYVTSTTGISFKNISSDTNGKGVYELSSTSNDNFPIYYYRGAVENNNLIFANFCWKIVRTTGTGGVKIIYNGTPTNGTCDNTGEAAIIGTKIFNNNHFSLGSVGYMYGELYKKAQIKMSEITNTYYYGNDVSYDKTTGKYTLTGGTISNNNWSNIYNGGLNNYHYTCFSTEITCTNVNYIFYTDSNYAQYIALSNGIKIEDAISEMLDNNTTSSIIKGNKDTEGTLDYWYYNNLEQTGYSEHLEDTVWCNDRGIYSLGGWDPNGGSTRLDLLFEPYNRMKSTFIPSLVCARSIDRFTVSEINGNGDLDYPVGLLTIDEVMLAGGRNSTTNDSFYLNISIDWWFFSPIAFNYIYGSNNAIFYDNKPTWLTVAGYSYTNIGIRPSVSLKKGTIILEGEGTVSDPYIVS